MYRGQYGEYVKLFSNTGKMSTDQLTLFIPSLVVLILCMNISYISFNFEVWESGVKSNDIPMYQKS